MKKSSYRSTLKITLIYFIIGLLWILISDQVLEFMAPESQLVRYQTYKGGFYIIATSIFLFFLIHFYRKRLYDKVEELEHANNNLRMVFYKASHDLRTPIVNISGLINGVKKAGLPSEYAPYCDKMEIATDNADRLIHELVTISNLFSEKVKLGSVNCDEIINDIIASNPVIRNATANIRLIRKFDQPKFLCDRFYLRIILERLLENSYRYYDRTKKDSWVSVTVEKAGKGNIILEVKDNGIGIEENICSKVFEMFYRGNESSKGAGLGLYIARTAVKRLGGTINIQSQPRIGSTFTVKLGKNHRKLFD